MFRKLLILIVVVWYSIPALAQISEVHGRIIDFKNKSPLVGVTVRLALKSDSTKAEFVGTDVDGKFVFGNVNFNTYVITATYVGYSSAEKNVVVNKRIHRCRRYHDVCERRSTWRDRGGRTGRAGRAKNRHG